MKTQRFRAGTWSIWQSCQGGGGNRATFTVTATTSTGTAEIGTRSGRYSVNTGPYDFEELSSPSVRVEIDASNTHGDSSGRGRRITIVNVNETETVSVSTTSPTVGQAVTASLSGGDDITSGPTWAWTRSGSNAVIGRSSSYTPTTSDAGKTLTATATYTDPFGSGKTASKSTGTVQQPANTPPAIIIDVKLGSVNENRPADIPIASIGANDAEDGPIRPILLRGAPYLTSAPRSNPPNHITISTTRSLDHETTPTINYRVGVIDSGDLAARRDFTLNVTDVDEPESVTLSTNNPTVGSTITARLTGGDKITGTPTWSWRAGTRTVGSASSYTPTASDAGKRLTATATYTDSHQSGRTASASTNAVQGYQNRPPTITTYPRNQTINENTSAHLTTIRATDPDGNNITYSVSDPQNRGYISGTGAGGSRATISTQSLNHETAASVLFNVTATDTHGASVSTTFTVTVRDVDEAERVSLSTTSPKVGTRITARLIPADDVLSGPTWAWTDGSTPLGTGNFYTPRTEDIGETLKATATYRDTHASNRKVSATTRAVQGTIPGVSVGFERGTYSVTEGSNQNIKVKLSADPKRSLTIRYTVTRQKGASTSDYTLSPTGSVTFNSGQTEKTINVAATQDSVDDDGEYINLTISTPLPSDVNMGSNRRATVNITDDDTPTGRISFRTRAHNVAEGQQTTITVDIDNWMDNAVTIPIIVDHRNGASTQDYSGVPSSVTFPADNDFRPASKVRTFTISATQDTSDDDNEYLILRLGTLPQNVSLATYNPTTRVNILDDDTTTYSAPYFTSIPSNISVRENTGPGVAVGSTIRATDPDGDSLTFSLYYGHGHITLTQTGNSARMYTTSTRFNYESRTYITPRIRVCDASLCADKNISIDVTNVNETEQVVLSPPANSTTTPKAGSPIRARITGGDTVSSVRWQWQSAPSRSGTYTSIALATSRTFTPTSAQVGSHLRAKATYHDPHGGPKTRRSAATLAVEEDPLALKSLTVSPVDVHRFQPSWLVYHVGLESHQTSATITLEPPTETTGTTVTVTQTYGTNPPQTLSLTSETDTHKTYTLNNLQPGLTIVNIQLGTSSNNLTKTYRIEIGRAVTAPLGWAADKDINTLRQPDNVFTTPFAATTNGSTVWVAYEGTNKLFAHSLLTGARQASSDITLLGITEPRAIWYHDSTMWAATSSKVRAFNLSGIENTTKSITLYRYNDRPTGLWSNNETLWVGDGRDSAIYAYDFTSKTRNQDLELHGITAYIAGIYSDGYTMWALNSQNRNIYAYDLDTVRYLSAANFTNLQAAGQRYPGGIFGHGSTLWVTDRVKNKIYAYNQPTLSDDTAITSFTLDGAEYVTQAQATLNKPTTNIIQDSVTQITVRIVLRHQDATAQIAVVPSENSAFSAGTASTYQESVSGYQIPLAATGKTHLKVKVTAQDGSTGEYYYFTNRPSTADLGLYGFTLKPENENATQIRGPNYSVPNTVDTVTITPIPNDKDNTVQITNPTDTDAQTTGHQAELQNGSNTFTVRVSEPSPGTNTEDHTITITKADGTSTWDPRLDFPTHEFNDQPWGIWSDRTTMHVSDYYDGLLYSYRMSSRTYDYVTDLRPHQNRVHPDRTIPMDPTDIWSDSQHFWVVNRFTWSNIVDNVTPRLHKLDLTGTVTELADDLLHTDIYDPTGIWSDGQTLWIADEVDHKLYAHTLDPFARNTTKDIALHTGGTDDAQKNQDPTGIWSDGQTLWVADQEDDKLYAYALADDPVTNTTESLGARDTAKDITLDPLNNEPRGIWGMPGILWVANDDLDNAANDKLYAYIVPTSDLTDLKVTIDSHDPFTLTPVQDTHIHRVASATGSITVTAVPLDVRAVAVIANPDADTAINGIQISHPTGPKPDLITIIVTAQDEETTHTYRIHLHRDPTAPTMGDSPKPAYQTLHLDWTPPEDPGTSPVTHYTIRYILKTGDETNDANWTEIQGLIPTETTPFTHALAGLTNGQEYDIGVRAVTEVSNSPWSTTVTATPSGKPTFDATGPLTADVPENSPAETQVGDPVAATDPDGDRITYSLSGTGAANFVIDQHGIITVAHNASLDYETDSSYTLTVQIHDSRKELSTDADARAIDNTIQFTISVTNLQEPGSIALNKTHPQVGAAVTATLTDPDGTIQNTTWQWATYDSKEAKQGADIANQTTASYTPVASDAGKFIGVKASYTDAAGAD